MLHLPPLGIDSLLRVRVRSMIVWCVWYSAKLVWSVGDEYWWRYSHPKSGRWVVGQTTLTVPNDGTSWGTDLVWLAHMFFGLLTFVPTDSGVCISSFASAWSASVVVSILTETRFFERSSWSQTASVQVSDPTRPIGTDQIIQQTPCRHQIRIERRMRNQPMGSKDRCESLARQTILQGPGVCPTGRLGPNHYMWAPLHDQHW